MELALDTDGETLARKLIDHAEHAEDFAIMRAVLDEVLRPDIAFIGRPQPDARSVAQPEPPAFGLFLRNFEPLTPPDAINAPFTHRPDCVTQ